MQVPHGLPLRSFSSDRGMPGGPRRPGASRPAASVPGEGFDAYLQGAPLGIELPVRLEAGADWREVPVPVRLEGLDPVQGRRLWLAAYLVLLGRYGNEEYCVGFPAFADTGEPPVLRTVYAGDEPSRTRLARLDEELEDARRRLTGEDPVPAGPRRDAGEVAARRCSAVVLGESIAPEAPAWLALRPTRDGQGARLLLRGPASAALARMAEHLGRIALGLLEGREAVGRIDWLDDEEKAALWALRGEPEHAPPVGLVHHLFEAQAARTPDRLALRARDRSLSYAELERASRALAARLVARGVGREQRIGVCLQRDSGLLVGLLAVLRAGACYVPLDPAYPDDRIAYMLGDADCTLVLVDETTQATIAALGYRTLVARVDATLDEPWRAPAGEASDLAYLIYTSGSTGQPKGVAIEHGSAHAFLCWAREVFSEAEWRDVLAATSVCFDLSIYELFGTLAWGGTVHLVDNLFALADYPRRDAITLINTVPSVCAALLALGDLPASVRTVNLAGEPLRGHLVRQLRRQPGVRRLLNLYGPTEDTTYSTVHELPASSEADEAEPPIGRPLPGTTVHVLDPYGAPVPMGVAGELYLGGVGLARGYFGKPEQTEARFLAAGRLPLVANERLYRTGDRVRMNEAGVLEHLGRLDDQVKFNGFRIELGEIASRLATFPGIHEGVAVLTADSAGLRRLVAYYVADAPLDAPALTDHLARTLPHYMLPSAFVRLPALPKTLNGKIDKKALPAPPAATAPAGEERPVAGDSVERAVRDAWQAVLGAPPIPGLGFYGAGGDSLRAVHLLAHVRRALGRIVSLRDFASGEATPDSLVALARQAPEAPREDRQTLAEPRLSLAERRLWVAQQLDPDGTAYNLQAHLRATGVEPDTLEHALRALLERHVALRRCVRLEADGPRPVPLPVEAVPFLRLAPEPDASRAALRLRLLAEENARRPFDLAREAPLRIAVTPHGDGPVVDILLDLHHYAFDDASLVIFAQDLLALLEGESLPPVAASPERLAAWEATELASGRPQAVAERWAAQLASSLRAEEGPRPALGPRPSGILSVPVAPSVQAACRRLAERASTSLFSAAIEAFGRTLAEAMGSREVLVGVALAGRQRLEAQGVITNCVNLLPLCVRVEPGAARLARVREVGDGLLDLLAHQDVPLETLSEALRQRDPASRGVPIRVACGAHTGRRGLFVGRACRLEAAFLPSPHARLDLTLWLEETPAGWTAVWTYARDLYAEHTVRQLHERWEHHARAESEWPDRATGRAPA